MEAVISESHFEQTVAVVMGETVEVHRGVIHAHHELYDLGLGGLEEVAMNRRHSTEDTLAQVEIVARGIVVEIGIETEESRKAHEKHQVEIGKVALLLFSTLTSLNAYIFLKINKMTL